MEPSLKVFGVEGDVQDVGIGNRALRLRIIGSTATGCENRAAGHAECKTAGLVKEAAPFGEFFLALFGGVESERAANHVVPFQ